MDTKQNPEPTFQVSSGLCFLVFFAENVRVYYDIFIEKSYYIRGIR